MEKLRGHTVAIWFKHHQQPNLFRVREKDIRQQKLVAAW